MNREQALEVVKANHAAHGTADIANLFKGGPSFNAQEAFGYRHGWYTVEGYSFREDEVSGIAYDITQGGWAFL